MSNEYGPMESMSPKQAKEEAARLTEQARKLKEYSRQSEIGEELPNKKTSSFSKGVINVSYIVFGGVGIIGSFWEQFDMTKYVMFLEAFTYIWAPLVIAVGGGRAVKNFVSKKYGEGEK